MNQYTPTSTHKGDSIQALRMLRPPKPRILPEDFAALVFGRYIIDTEKDGTKYYQLTESGIQAGKW